MDYYTLNEDGTVARCPGDLHEQMRAYFEWFERNHERRIIGKDVIEGHLVSTIFLGLDHSRLGSGPFLLETMVFDQREGPERPWIELDLRRYRTIEEARAGHAEVVALWRAKLASEGHDLIGTPIAQPGGTSPSGSDS